MPFAQEPTGVSTSGVTLNARIYTSFGGEVTYWFRYGTTKSYGSETPHRTVEMADDSSRGVSEPIPITGGTEYHWQVCSQDAEESPPRTVCSRDESLYVGPVEPQPDHPQHLGHERPAELRAQHPRSGCHPQPQRPHVQRLHQEPGLR